MEKLRIVFMGTPDFAVGILDTILKNKYNVVGVITAADKPAGRGQVMHESPVKQFALEHQLPIAQPEKLKSPEFFAQIQAWQPDIQIVVAFRMLPETIWSYPPMGTLNVHGSLLPKYRGAAPINWAIINGEKETGVTTFRLQHAIDTGDILLQERIPISQDMTAGELHDTMMEVGAQTLVKTLVGLIAGTIQSKPQEETLASLHAPKIFTKDCQIDWQQPVAQIHNLIRGLAPFPGALTKVDGKIVKLFSTSIVHENPKEPAGSFVTDGKTYVRFTCSDGYIQLNDIQWEGKKRMPIADFLRGYKKVD